MGNQITIKEVLSSSILGLILLVLIALNVYLFMFNEDMSISFTDLFNRLEQMDAIDTTFIKLNFDTGITADWGAFNFAKDFINGLWQIIGVALYVCVLIVNAMVYVFEIIKILFVGVLG